MRIIESLNTLNIRNMDISVQYTLIWKNAVIAAVIILDDISAFPIRKWRDTERKVIGIDCCLVSYN
jgi:hypothetical protein